jgi:hypothetical protein
LKQSNEHVNIDVLFSIKPLIIVHAAEVEPQYTGARLGGDAVTLDFIKQMLDDFKRQKCIHKRYTVNFKGQCLTTYSPLLVFVGHW